MSVAARSAASHLPHGVFTRNPSPSDHAPPRTAALRIPDSASGRCRGLRAVASARGDGGSGALELQNDAASKDSHALPSYNAPQIFLLSVDLIEFCLHFGPYCCFFLLIFGFRAFIFHSFFQFRLRWVSPSRRIPSNIALGVY